MTRVLTRSFLFLLLLCLAHLASCGRTTSGTEPKSIAVRMVATWTQTPLLPEAAEFFGNDNAAFWWFLDSLLKEQEERAFGTEREQMAWLKALALRQEHGGGPASAAVLEYSLATGVYSPKADMWRQVYLDHLAAHHVNLTSSELRDCKGAVFLSGRFLCDPTDLTVTPLSEDSSTEPLLLSFDRVYPGGPTPPGDPVPTAVLYGELGSRGLVRLHKKLRQLTLNQSLRYVFRPLVAESGSLQPVQGWGVQLDIKDVEYKVIDDTKLDLSGMEDLDDESDQGQEEQEGGEVGGFDFDVLKKRRPDLATLLNELRNKMIADSQDEEVKMWDLGSLGYQASLRISRAEVKEGGSQKNGLEMLREVAQNFPSHLSALAKLKLPATFKPTLTKRFEQYGIREGSNAVMINGQVVSMEGQDAGMYKLQELVEMEARAADGLAALGLANDVVGALLSAPLPPLGTEKTSDGSPSFTYKLELDKKGEEAAPVLWLNNLERDKRYRGGQWHKGLNGLLTPGWPNQIRYVAKNLYHVIIILDPASAKSLWVLKKLKYYTESPRDVPIRLGVLFLLQSDSSSGAAWAAAKAQAGITSADYSDLLAATSSAQSAQADDLTVAEVVARLAYFLHQDKAEKSWNFLGSLYEAKKELDVESVKEKFAQTFLGKKESDTSKADEAYKQALDQSPVSDPSKFVQQTRKYMSKRGLDAPKVVSGNTGKGVGVLVNGKLDIMTSFKQDSFQAWLATEITTLQRNFMRAAYFDLVNDKTDFMAYPDTQSSAHVRVSPHIFQPWEELVFLSAVPTEALSSLPYVAGSDQAARQADVTLWAVTDLDSLDGLELARGALQVLRDNMGNSSADAPRMRLCVLPSHAAQAESASGFASYFLRAQLALFGHERSGRDEAALRFLLAAATLARLALLPGKAHSTPEERWPLLRAALEREASKAGLQARLSTDSNKSPALSAVRDSLLPHVPNEAQAIIVNGRVISFPEHSPAEGVSADLALLLEAELVPPLTKLLGSKGVSLSGDAKVQASLQLSRRAVANHGANAGTSLSFGMAHYEPAELSKLFSDILQQADQTGVLKSAHKADSPSWLSVQAILDPVSEAAPLLSEILLGLSTGLGADVAVLLNPSSKITGVPLPKFYRYVFSPALNFDASGKRLGSQGAAAAGALFTSLRTSKLLSLQLSSPSSWLVESSITPMDVDNINLPELETSSLTVQYSLEKLLVSGNCYEPDGFTAPAGLQLYLASPSKPQAGDTLVMENLGYFQIQANPGVWSLSLAPSHNTVYRIVQGPNEMGPEGKMQVAVSSYYQAATKLQVHRRAGQELTKLEDLDSSPGSVSSLLSSLWGSGGVSSNETVHIFSIASGFLYERFLKIMMQSVVRNTKSPVKFWFIKNFLSPQFKAQARDLARHDGFEVEFVTYRWPSWLRAQSVKQRVIWGYKILFLDVLFPLALKRIIYIDADQVVRGDVKELWDKDLKGAPYAYTPFCDSNTETEGYRFWKQGYWKSHLRNLPYHISALYVVDLRRFRQMRAGDRLRITYQSLTEDPNSLANLDQDLPNHAQHQDLPNHAQHQVPIHSLPQEWLWCQTWCSMESLPKAKTIDLCNNPMTKTPKLEVAKSLLPEWIELDERARKLAEEFEAKAQLNMIRSKIEQKEFCGKFTETSRSISGFRAGRSPSSRTRPKC
eukprot:g82303.t1